MSNGVFSFNRGEVNMGAVSAIEQRWSQRRSASLDVDVVKDSSLLARCRARDVSLGGVFLEIDENIIDKCQDVELIFTLAKSEAAQHKLKARTVRVAADGIGLMFKDFDTNSFRALQEIMRYSIVSSN